MAVQPVRKEKRKILTINGNTIDFFDTLKVEK